MTRRSTAEARVAFLASLAGLLFTHDSRAAWGGSNLIAGLGISVGPSFAPGHTRLDLRLEAYGAWNSWYVRGDSSAPCFSSWSVGPSVQASLIGSPHTVVVAAQIGGGSMVGLGAELGAAFAGGDIGPHVGAALETGPLYLSVRNEQLSSTTVALGARYKPPYADHRDNGCIVYGRPHRDSSGHRSTGTHTHLDRWSSDAQAEAESVLAFLDLALQLLENDAPDMLIFEAIASAEDELTHALLVSAETEDAWPRLRHFAPRPRLGLEQIAAESWTDGWINEGMAALDARSRADLNAGTTRSTLLRIAGDEARHARLGLSIAQWAAARSGGALARAFEHPHSFPQ